MKASRRKEPPSQCPWCYEEITPIWPARTVRPIPKRSEVSECELDPE